MKIFSFALVLLSLMLALPGNSSAGAGEKTIFDDNAMLVASGRRLMLYHHDDSARLQRRPINFFETDSKILSVEEVEEKAIATVVVFTASRTVYRLSVTVTGANYGSIEMVESFTLPEAERVWLATRGTLLVFDGSDVLGYRWSEGSLQRNQSLDIDLPEAANIVGVAFGGSTHEGWIFLADSVNEVVWQMNYFDGVGFGEARPFVSGKITGVATGTRPALQYGVETVVFVSTKDTITRYDQYGSKESSVNAPGTIQAGSVSAYYDSKITAICKNADGMMSVVEVKSTGYDLLPEPTTMADRKRISAVFTTSSTGVIVN